MPWKGFGLSTGKSEPPGMITPVSAQLPTGDLESAEGLCLLTEAPGRSGIGGRSQRRVAALERLDDRVDGDVRMRPAIADILHVTPPAHVVGVEERVGQAVELERPYTEPLAQSPIEGRCLNDTPATE